MPKATCANPGCGNRAHAKGLCSKHYHQQKYGYPGRLEMPDRFWVKVHKTDTCWLWIASRDGAGYGTFLLDGRVSGAHRVAYELLVGPIPDGLMIDHKCYVPACVNPDHLQVVTRQQNRENISGVQRNNLHSGVRGVGFHPRDGVWFAYARRNGKTYYNGCAWRTIEEAEAAAIELRNRLMSNNLLDRGLNIVGKNA